MIKYFGKFLICSSFGKFRIFSQFWQVLGICQIWSFLPHVAIFGKICHSCWFWLCANFGDFASFGNCSPFWHFGTFCNFRNLLILVLLAILTGLSPFWKSWAILANCGYLPILIEFANFGQCCIFSHLGKGSPFYFNQFACFFSANC